MEEKPFSNTDEPTVSGQAPNSPQHGRCAQQPGQINYASSQYSAPSFPTTAMPQTSSTATANESSPDTMIGRQPYHREQIGHSSSNYSAPIHPTTVTPPQIPSITTANKPSPDSTHGGHLQQPGQYTQRLGQINHTSSHYSAPSLPITTTPPQISSTATANKPSPDTADGRQPEYPGHINHASGHYSAPVHQTTTTPSQFPSTATANNPSPGIAQDRHPQRPGLINHPSSQYISSIHPTTTTPPQIPSKMTANKPSPDKTHGQHPQHPVQINRGTLHYRSPIHPTNRASTPPTAAAATKHSLDTTDSQYPPGKEPITPHYSTSNINLSTSKEPSQSSPAAAAAVTAATATTKHSPHTTSSQFPNHKGPITPQHTSSNITNLSTPKKPNPSPPAATPATTSKPPAAPDTTNNHPPILDRMHQEVQLDEYLYGPYLSHRHDRNFFTRNAIEWALLRRKSVEAMQRLSDLDQEFQGEILRSHHSRGLLPSSIIEEGKSVWLSWEVVLRGRADKLKWMSVSGLWERGEEVRFEFLRELGNELCWEAFELVRLRRAVEEAEEEAKRAGKVGRSGVEVRFVLSERDFEGIDPNARVLPRWTMGMMSR